VSGLDEPPAAARGTAGLRAPEQTMRDPASVHARIGVIFYEKLNIDRPATDVDLLETGVLDSLMLLSLLLELEKSFGVRIELEKLDFDDFKSVDRIVQLVVAADGRRDG
jgi:acyl carrier protein